MSGVPHTPPPFSGGTLVCHTMTQGIDHLHSRFRFLVYIPLGTGKAEGGGSIMSRALFSLIRSSHSSDLWSVWIVKERPSKYTLKACIANLIARHYFSIMEYRSTWGSSFQQKNATGWSCVVGARSGQVCYFWCCCLFFAIFPCDIPTFIALCEFCSCTATLPSKCIYLQVPPLSVFPSLPLLPPQGPYLINTHGP